MDNHFDPSRVVAFENEDEFSFWVPVTNISERTFPKTGILIGLFVWMVINGRISAEITERRIKILFLTYIVSLLRNSL